MILFPPAVRFMMLSALGFALMSASVKLVSGWGIPVLEIVAARSLVSLAISYVDIQRKGLSVWGNHKPLLMARGLFGAFSLMCVFYSVTTLQLAQATVLQYTYPAFTAVLALIFLKERIQLSTITCLIMSFIGLLVVVGPNMDGDALVEIPWLSLAAALTGAFGSACAYVIVRRLSRSEDSSVIIFYFPLIALPISLLLLGSDFVMPGLKEIAILVLIGIFTQIGQVGLTKAMACEEAGKASAYAYIQVVFAAVLGLFLFGETPSLWTVLGGLIIIMGALVNTLWKR